jgi:hypothetical protein
MISPRLRDLLEEIVRDTERLDKLTVQLDLVSRTLTIVYEDLDDEWFWEACSCVGES